MYMSYRALLFYDILCIELIYYLVHFHLRLYNVLYDAPQVFAWMAIMLLALNTIRNSQFQFYSQYLNVLIFYYYFCYLISLDNY